MKESTTVLECAGMRKVHTIAAVGFDSIFNLVMCVACCVVMVVVLGAGCRVPGRGGARVWVSRVNELGEELRAN